MSKLDAIDKLVDGLKVRLTSWLPKTKHVFMEESGNTYVADRINDPNAKLINLNYQHEYEWELLKRGDFMGVVEIFITVVGIIAFSASMVYLFKNKKRKK